MKLMYGNVPVKSLNIHSYELNTNDCDMVASDLQAGKTAVARGQKIIGTGKCFEFASYGEFEANDEWSIPSDINVIQITCLSYPTQTLVDVRNTKNLDFSTEQTIGELVADNTEYPINVTVLDNILKIACGKTVTFQVFYGKDNYV